MEKQFKIRKSIFKIVYLLLVSVFILSCTDDADDYKRRHDFNMEMTASAEDVFLNEKTPDDVALALEWTPAVDRGLNYNITYEYVISLSGGESKNDIKQYIDNGDFKINYTHKQLQDLLIDHWGQKTGRTVALEFNLTATFEGSNLIIPEVSSSAVKIHLYGPKQFEAEKLFIGGTAVGSNDIELKAQNSNSTLFASTIELSAGTINFPIVYGLDNKVNTIGASTPNEESTSEAMTASVTDSENANSWAITEAEAYRITVDLTAKTVRITPVGEAIVADEIYLAGTAVGEEIELMRTLENENVFAFHGKLKAGSLYLPILLDGEKTYSIVPSEGGVQDINDGNPSAFTQMKTSVAEGGRHWNIPNDDTYRVVLNIETKEITIYSSVTDLKPKVITGHKNTVTGSTVLEDVSIEALWMWGGFNNWIGDGSSSSEKGFSEKYKLTPSLANPYIFVYKGDVLPKEKESGSVKFCITNVLSNVYAYSSASTRGKFINVTQGDTNTVYEGQADNRYSYFIVPDNTNFIVVDIEKLTVVFDHKE